MLFYSVIWLLPRQISSLIWFTLYTHGPCTGTTPGTRKNGHRWNLTVQVDTTKGRACGTTARVPQIISENIMENTSSFFSLSILTLCIMRLTDFIIKEVPVHKQFIPNPSTIFKRKFPWLQDVSSSISAINFVLHSYFCLTQWKSSSCLFLSNSILIQCLIASHKSTHCTNLLCNTCCSFRPSLISKPAV